MMRNNLTIIGNRYFTGLAGLETLHLKSNKIATIEPEALLPLTSLEFLDLSFNSLDHLYGFGKKYGPLSTVDYGVENYFLIQISLD